MLIKICGITRLEDARFAVECGANALGFVFWPASPRSIDPARAQAIAALLPPFVTPVGVFVNQPAEYVNAVAAAVGLGVVQLHGDESLDFAASLKRPVLKAMTLADGRLGDRSMAIRDDGPARCARSGAAGRNRTDDRLDEGRVDRGAPADRAGRRVDSRQRGRRHRARAAVRHRRVVRASRRRPA